MHCHEDVGISVEAADAVSSADVKASTRPPSSSSLRIEEK
jgi:hypothetical protein